MHAPLSSRNRNASQCDLICKTSLVIDGVRRRESSNSGFTLLELLGTIAILGILAALLVPAASKMRENAQSAGCLSNLRRLHQGSMAYLADHDNKFWPAYYNGQNGWYDDFPESAAGGRGPLYYLEYNIYRDNLKRKTVMDCPTNKKGHAAWNLDYAYNAYLNPVTYSGTPGGSSYSLAQPSKTILFMDSHFYQLCPGYGPVDKIQGGGNAGQTVGAFVHPNKTANCVFVDGHVESITEQTFKDSPLIYVDPSKPVP